MQPENIESNLNRKRKCRGKILKSRYDKALYIMEKIENNERNGTPHEKDRRSRYKCQKTINDYLQYREERAKLVATACGNLAEEEEMPNKVCDLQGAKEDAVIGQYYKHLLEEGSTSSDNLVEVQTEEAGKTMENNQQLDENIASENLGKSGLNEDDKLVEENVDNSKVIKEISTTLKTNKSTKVTQFQNVNETLSVVALTNQKVQEKTDNSNKPTEKSQEKSTRSLFLDCNKNKTIAKSFKNPKLYIRTQRSISELINNSLFMVLAGVRPATRRLHPVVDEWPKIELKISEFLMKHLLDSKQKAIPRYKSGETFHGFLLIQCYDRFSKDFLSSCISKLQKDESFKNLELKVYTIARFYEIRKQQLEQTFKITNSSKKCENIAKNYDTQREHNEKNLYLNLRKRLDYYSKLENLTKPQRKKLMKYLRKTRAYELRHNMELTEYRPEKTTQLITPQGFQLDTNYFKVNAKPKVQKGLQLNTDYKTESPRTCLSHEVSNQVALTRSNLKDKPLDEYSAKAHILTSLKTSQTDARNLFAAEFSKRSQNRVGQANGSRNFPTNQYKQDFPQNFESFSQHKDYNSAENFHGRQSANASVQDSFKNDFKSTTSSQDFGRNLYENTSRSYGNSFSETRGNSEASSLNATAADFPQNSRNSNRNIDYSSQKLVEYPQVFSRNMDTKNSRNSYNTENNLTSNYLDIPKISREDSLFERRVENSNVAAAIRFSNFPQYSRDSCYNTRGICEITTEPSNQTWIHYPENTTRNSTKNNDCKSGDLNQNLGVKSSEFSQTFSRNMPSKTCWDNSNSNHFPEISENFYSSYKYSDPQENVSSQMYTNEFNAFTFPVTNFDFTESLTSNRAMNLDEHCRSSNTSLFENEIKKAKLEMKILQSLNEFKSNSFKRKAEDAIQNRFLPSKMNREQHAPISSSSDDPNQRHENYPTVIISSDDSDNEELDLNANYLQKYRAEYYKALDCLKARRPGEYTDIRESERSHRRYCEKTVKNFGRRKREETRDHRSSLSKFSSLRNPSPKRPTTVFSCLTNSTEQQGFWSRTAETQNQKTSTNTATTSQYYGPESSTSSSFTNANTKSSRPDLQIAIIDRNHPDFKISQDSWQNLEKLLLETLLNEMQTSNNNRIGMFDGMCWRNGIKIVQCDNLDSLDFIKRFIRQQCFRQTGSHYDVIPVKDLPKRSVVKVRIPPPILNDQGVLKLIKAQNSMFNSSDWTLVNSRENSNHNGKDFYVSVTSTSLEKLKSTKGQIRYGLNHLQMVLPEQEEIRSERGHRTSC